MPVDAVDVVVVRLPQFHIRHILQQQLLARGQRGNHHVLELRHLGFAPCVAQHILEHVVGIAAQRADRGLDVLLRQHSRYVARHQFVACHHVGLEPDAQGVLRAPHLHLAHALDAQQGGTQVVVEIVAQEVLVVGAVGTFQRDDAELSRLPFLGGYACLQHLGGQLCLCLDDAILHIHSGHIGIGTLLEVDGQAGRAVAGRRGHIGHPLYAVDGLLQRHHHALLHRFGTRTRVARPHIDGGRRNVGISFHRQRQQRNHAQQHDYHANDHR